jgi:hypothetical protein
MAYESRIEDMVYDVKGYVSTNINTYLTGITTNKGDGITLSNFRKVDVGEGDIENLGIYPTCLVNPVNVKDEILSMGNNSLTIEIAFAIIITGGNKDNLVIQAMRYAEAFRQLFLADTTCGDTVGGMDAETNVQYFPSIPGKNDKKLIIFTATFFKDVVR